MARRNKIYYILSLILVLTSCLKQKVINIDKVPNQYVVNGLFSPNDTLQVSISKSQFLNDTNNINYISNAQVQLFENDNYLENLTYQPPLSIFTVGIYNSSFTNFKTGKNYSIKVNIPGYEKEISASDIIPKSTARISQLAQLVDQDTIIMQYSFNLQSTDPNTDDYYHLFFEQRSVQWILNGSDTLKTFTPWTQALTLILDNPESFIANTSEPFLLNVGESLYGFMLDDKTVGPNGKTINVFTNKLPSFGNSYLESRIVVHSVSKKYFDYYLSVSQYNRTKDVPLSEAVIISNNIINGIGNFSGFVKDSSAAIRTY